jgi:hypothetical protein
VLRWKGMSMVARLAALSTPGVLLPWHSNWQSITPSPGLTWHVSAPQTPLNPYSAPVAPHSALLSTSSLSAAGSSNTSSTAASTPSTTHSATPNCMRQSRMLTASSLSCKPVTWPFSLKPAHRSPHPLSLTREVSIMGLLPLYTRDH